MMKRPKGACPCRTTKPILRNDASFYVAAMAAVALLRYLLVHDTLCRTVALFFLCFNAGVKDETRNCRLFSLRA